MMRIAVLAFLAGIITALLVVGNGSVIAAQDNQGRDVVLEKAGPSTVAQAPASVPADQALRQQEYTLRNMSAKDIVFYSIVFTNEHGTIIAELGRASYPPDPPIIRAGTTQTITRRYIDNAIATKAQAQIDSIVFADGSSYGQDILKRKAGYAASVETQYLFARSMSDLLATKGPEAVKKHLARIVEVPSPLVTNTAVNATKSSRNKGSVKIESACTATKSSKK